MDSLTNTQLIAGAGVALGEWWLIGQKILALINPKLAAILAQILKILNVETTPTVSSSDRPAPEGFEDHVATIMMACPAACDGQKCTYLSQGLTEAQTLRAEVERLSAEVTP